MESLLREVGTCGEFQVCHVTLVQLCRVFVSCSLALMIYGLLNPGWRCVPSTTNTTSSSNLDLDLRQDVHSFANNFQSFNGYQATNDSHQNYTSSELSHYRYHYNATCDVINSCGDGVIEFDPSSSTIVTEFGLVCDKVWIGSLIVSVLNAGMLAGNIVWSQIGERFGRTVSMYTANLVIGGASALAVLSPRWEVYAFFTFLIGFGATGTNASLNTLTMEFVSNKWRARLSSLPVWNMGLLFFAASAYLLRDWRHIHLVIAGGCGVACLGALWTPESLRWLVIHGKTQRAQAVVDKISRLNGKRAEKESLERLMDSERGETSGDPRKHYNYTFLDLFKTRDVCILTIKLSLIRVVIMVVYEMIGFSIQSLPGDFYLNMFIMVMAEIPMVMLIGPMANTIGRRWTCIIFASLGSLCCIALVICLAIMDKTPVRDILVTSLALANRSLVDAISNILISYSAELMPTAVRNLSFGFADILARVFGIVSPYMLPRDYTSMLVCFSVLMTSQVFSTGLFYSLAETKGKPMIDTIKRRPIVRSTHLDEKA